MNCPHCQKILPDDYPAEFCPFCGKDLSPAEQPGTKIETTYLSPVKFPAAIFFSDITRTADADRIHRLVGSYS
jgi:hypothetical protein